MSSQFATVYETLCKVDSNSLKNRLRMIAEDLTKTAVDVFGRGYTVIAAGEAAHVISCVEIEVATRTLANCTRDLPIMYGRNNSQLGFREPITHQIIEYSAPVPCDPIMPIMHNLLINGHEGWYCITPGLAPCRAPMELDPTVKFKLSARDYGAELVSNLYAAWQEDAHRHAMFVHSTRRGIFDNLGNSAREQGSGRPGQDWQPGMPINDNQFNTMVETMGDIISTLFSLLGNGVW